VIDPATLWRLAVAKLFLGGDSFCYRLWNLGGRGYVVPPEPVEDKGEPQTILPSRPQINVLQQDPTSQEPAQQSVPEQTTSAQPLPDEG
jgi:hypothetical protein